VLLLTSTLALPSRRLRGVPLAATSNFVGEGTNELATAILQVLYLPSRFRKPNVIYTMALQQYGRMYKHSEEKQIILRDRNCIGINLNPLSNVYETPEYRICIQS
jgi:hypothetical protein